MYLTLLDSSGLITFGVNKVMCTKWLRYLKFKVAKMVGNEEVGSLKKNLTMISKVVYCRCDTSSNICVFTNSSSVD